MRRAGFLFLLAVLAVLSPPSSSPLGAQAADRPQAPDRPQGAGRPAGPDRPQGPQPAGPARRPARDTPPTAKEGTARIKGRVLSAENGAPLRRAQVRVSGENFREGHGAITDAQGRFEIKDLPAGRYNVSVSKTGYVSMQFGQRAPRDPGKPLEVADGQAIDKLDFSLPRAGVITGRIIDEAGEPMSDVLVAALRYMVANGERRLVNAGRPLESNDIGQFRIYGLPPGEYYVSATFAGGGRFFGPGAEEMSNDTGYAPTYFPGTTNVAEAQRVTVAAGQEQNTGDLALMPVRTVRVSGVVLDSRGRPQPGTNVFLRPEGRDTMMFQMFSSRGGAAKEDGSFVLTGVAPGSYVLMTRPNFRRGLEDDEAEFAQQPLTVGTDDVAGVSLITAPGASATGQIVFEGQPPARLDDISIFPRAVEGGRFGGPGMGMMGRPPAVRPDGTFELKNLFGPQRLLVTGANGWEVKAILQGATDVTDAFIDFRPGETVRDIRIVLTNRLTEVSGTAQDSRGRPLTDFSVIVFAQDSAKWRLPQSRYIETARADQDGRFKVTGLPPEDYLIVAVESVPEGGAADPDYLEQIRGGATRLILSEGEKKSVDLRLSAHSQ